MVIFVHISYSTVLHVHATVLCPNKNMCNIHLCSIQTKSYRLYRKMASHGYLCMRFLFIYFFFDTTQLFSLHVFIFSFGYQHALDREMVMQKRFK